MTDLYDIQHLYGDDVAVSSTGDFALVCAEERTQLRVIRRLLTATTNPKGSSYPWQPEYGAGLGEKIGEALDRRVIQAIVRTQMILEPSVAKVPIPVITVNPMVEQGGAEINIKYTTLLAEKQDFTFNLTP